MSSRIEQIIEEIEEYVDSCKFQPLSSTKIVVNKEELEELLRELRMKTPDEIKRYQKIISNKDAILMGALQYTDEMLANLEKIMSHTIDAAGEKYNTFINSIQSCYDIVNKNRRELSPGGNPASYAAPQQDADYDDDEA